MITEELVNAAIFVEEEMRKRGLKIPDWKDDLEKQMKIFVVEYPSPEGLQEEINLDKVVGSFPDTLPSDFPPIPIFLMGRIVNEGKIPANHDIDVLVKGPFLEGMVYFIKSICTDPAIARRLHVTFDLRGPMIGYSYPLYNYDYKKSTINKKLSPWEILAELKPLTYHKNQKPEKEVEVWDADVLWREWAEERIAHKLHVQKKFDGMCFQIHRKADEVRFFTEDSHVDRQDVFKKSREELLKISGAYIIHAEMVEYSDEGRALKREEMIKWINAKPESLDDKNVVFHVHDITYLNEEQLVEKGYGDRYRALKNLIPGSLKHFEAVPSVIAEDRQEFFKAVEDVRTMPGSEGAMVKDSTGIYKTQCASSSCRTNDMAKVKNLKEIDVIVLKRVPKKTAEGKEMNQYTYESGIEIPCESKGEFKQVEEIGGKCYARIGESYSTAEKHERGDIIVVRPVQVVEYVDKGLRTLAWMFPLFVGAATKTEPDDYKFFKRLEAVGIGWRAGLTYMPVCPHVHNAKKCVLKERFCRPFYWLSNLKFPVKCIYADHFRCAYVKDYYYQRLQIGTDQEYPTEESKRRYVMQSHIRGDSQHTDVRMEWDGFLVGYEVVGGSVKEPITPDKWEINKGQRIEWKTTQPKDWLEVEGKIEPGQIGATQREAGELKIVSKGEFWEGAQKPYFKEFFYKSDRDTGPLKKDKYVRVVVRGLRLPLLDPETKKKIPGKYEIVWRFMVPEDQVAYALERGMKKGWKPPRRKE